MLKLIGDSGSGLFLMDRELGQRVFTAFESQNAKIPDLLIQDYRCKIWF